MAEFDVEAFVIHLQGMGMKLSSIPLADGSFRIGRWRMVNAADDQQIQEFWASQIGDDQQRIDMLAAYLARKTPPIISFGTYRPPSGAPTAAPESAAPVEETSQTTPPPAAVPHGPTIAQRSASIQAANLAKTARVSPSGGVPETPLSDSPKSTNIEDPAAASVVPDAHKSLGLRTGSTMPRPLGIRPAATGSRSFGPPTKIPPRPLRAPATASTPELSAAPDVMPVPSEHLPAPGRPAAAEGPLPHDAPAPSEGSKDPAS
jgi:hypothetical protein